MLRTIGLLALATLFLLARVSVASAFDDSGHFSRQVVCISPGDDVLMELYLPHPNVYGNRRMSNPKKPVSGYFALDLDKLGKGKSIEPVRVWRDDKANVLHVDRYSRGLPRVAVPLDGGIVDFDQRFAQGARCKPYGSTREDEQVVAYPPAEATPPEPDASGAKAP
jgi:hypothetical protein